MAAIYRQPYLQVTVNGTPLTDVLSADVRLGLNVRVAAATVEVTSLPAGIVPWDDIVITMGASSATAAVRFTGYFVAAANRLYPKSTTLTCAGKLVLAERYENATQIDMSNAGAGATDEVLISTVLYYCNLAGVWTPADAPTAMTGIGGTSKTLGTVAKERAFSWYAGASGIAFIDLLDGICLGYRTYDTFDGTIKRTQVTTIPASAESATFTEHVDILAATETTTILQASNRVVVSGFPGLYGNAPISYTASGGNPYLVIDDVQQYVTSNLGSATIEKQNTADAGDGLSCEEVANWLLDERNRYREIIELTTPRDDVIEPGDTIAIAAPTRLGLSRRFWVEGVTMRIDAAGSFTQSFTCMAGVPVTLLMENGDFILTEDGLYLLESE
jgi:hypothetical protein